jgi:hypothetical protein
MPPRPFFALLAGLLTFSLALLLFRHQQQASFSSFAYPGFFGSGPGRSLSAWVLDEEARYDVVLQDRQQLINRWTTSFDSYVLLQSTPIIRICAALPRFFFVVHYLPFA